MQEYTPISSLYGTALYFREATISDAENNPSINPLAHYLLCRKGSGKIVAIIDNAHFFDSDGNFFDESA